MLSFGTCKNIIGPARLPIVLLEEETVNNLDCKYHKNKKWGYFYFHWVRQIIFYSSMR